MAVRKTKWLNNGIHFISHYALCVDEADYWRVMDELKCKVRYPYCNTSETANAWVKTLAKADGEEVHLVCLGKDLLSKSVPVICGYLAHEATHIWQFVCDYIGEKEPSREFEAYMIQHITTELISEFFNHKFKKLVK